MNCREIQRRVASEEAEWRRWWSMNSTFLPRCPSGEQRGRSYRVAVVVVVHSFPTECSIDQFITISFHQGIKASRHQGTKAQGTKVSRHQEGMATAGG